MVVGRHSYASADVTTERSPDMHCAGGYVGPRVGLVESEDVTEEAKVRFPMVITQGVHRNVDLENQQMNRYPVLGVLSLRCV